jgi:hypothetical protein
MGLEQALLDRGILDTGDRWIMSGQLGAAREEVLNVWSWDAACGLLCLLALSGILIGFLLLKGGRQGLSNRCG